MRKYTLNYRTKGQHFNYSFFVWFVTPPPPPLEIPACYVWPNSRSLWKLSTHTETHAHMYRVWFTSEKPQYLGFSNSYLEFPLVCEMGTFSLTDQQQ